MKCQRNEFLQAFVRSGFVALMLSVLGSSFLLSSQPGTASAESSFSANLFPSSHRWIGSDGKPLPLQSGEEILEFLRTAEVVKWEDIPEGVTRPRKVLLEKDGVRANAIFRDVEIYRREWTDPNVGPRRNFRDSCVYECAAYQLGRLLGMNNIPPVVRRELKRTKGTLQLWIEGARTEKERARSNLRAPNLWRWGMQNRMVQLFDQLVYNDDRNPGNLLIDPEWKIWMIDHTRCFRTFSDLPALEKIRFCENRVWENLNNLEEEVVKETLEGLLKTSEIKSLLKRWEKLVKHIQGLIEQNGEKSVLFSFRPAATKRADSSG